MEQQLVLQFLKLGCRSQKNAIITFQVYMELCEVKRLHDVQYYYNENLQTMYLTARNTKSAQPLIYIPMLSSENISFNMMERMLELNQTESKSIYLALISPDTTCVYYQLSEGLASISNLTTKISKSERKLDAELNKRISEIQQAAYLKIPLGSLKPDVTSSSSSSSTLKLDKS